MMGKPYLGVSTSIAMALWWLLSSVPSAFALTIICYLGSWMLTPASPASASSSPLCNCQNFGDRLCFRVACDRRRCQSSSAVCPEDHRRSGCQGFDMLGSSCERKR
ncbi:hypothetical protein F5Y06DRAFT_279835 [Hypoxylon sp. FL0890]|nr:hypothetical protein F5Y06DRAFT_279835 [Hypoxylon sp. FL0890]